MMGELRKETERERRRMRDRERRQSMSLEEKEKHLARRRRNYQLRRQRAETARLNPIQCPFTNALICVPDVTPQFNAAADDDTFLRSNHGQQLDTGSSHIYSTGLEIPAHKLAILSGKLRLSRIKHLARGVAIGGMMKENGISNCLTSKGLRLNRIKRLARTKNPACKRLLLKTIKV